MSPCASCTVAPRVTRVENGAMNAAASAMKAASMPMVRLPSMMSHAPHVSMSRALNCVRNTGTAPRNCVLTPSVCVASTTAAWCPPKRAKKSSSIPPALTVSIICRPAIVVPVSLPYSCSSRRLASVRWRDTTCRATRLRAATTTPTSVSGTE